MSANSPWMDLGARVFDAHQRFLASGDPADEREWLDLHAEQVARHDCSVCDQATNICRCTFDASPEPQLERKTDMSQSSDYRQGQRDADVALKRRADYTDGARAAEAAGPIGPRQAPLHLRPLSELVMTAVSKQTPGEARQRSREHFDALDAEADHRRAQAALHAKIQAKHQRELLSGRPHLDAAASADAETCEECGATKNDGVCPECGDGAKGGVLGSRSGKRALARSATPPWRRPLLVSSERAAPIPSRAMRFGRGPDDEVA